MASVSVSSARLSRGTRLWALTAAIVAILGLAGAAAYAYLSTAGFGSGSSSVGQPLAVTVNAISGTADLLPGGTGAAFFTLHNPNLFGVSYSQVTSASVSSDNTTACSNANLSIAQTMPYTFSPMVTAGANATSGTQSIPNLVKLDAAAPTGCQGITFNVTLTLSGKST